MFLRRAGPQLRLIQQSISRRAPALIQKRTYADEGEDHGHRIQPDEKMKPVIIYGFAIGLVLLGFYLKGGSKDEKVKEKLEEKHDDVAQKVEARH